jgi:hypothetical protein
LYKTGDKKKGEMGKKKEERRKITGKWKFKGLDKFKLERKGKKVHELIKVLTLMGRGK